MIRYRLRRSGVQHLPAVEFRQGGKAAVEGIGDACVVVQVGNEQGKGGFRVAAVRRLLPVAVGVLLDGGHSAEHPVVAAVVLAVWGVEGTAQAVVQFAGCLHGGAVGHPFGEGGAQVGFQPCRPPLHVLFQFPGIADLCRRALCVGEGASVAC